MSLNLSDSREKQTGLTRAKLLKKKTQNNKKQEKQQKPSKVARMTKNKHGRLRKFKIQMRY